MYSLVVVCILPFVFLCEALLIDVGNLFGRMKGMT